MVNVTFFSLIVAAVGVLLCIGLVAGSVLLYFALRKGKSSAADPRAKP